MARASIVAADGALMNTAEERIGENPGSGLKFEGSKPEVEVSQNTNSAPEMDDVNQ